MELQSTIPEIKVTEGQTNLLGRVDITHSDVSVSQTVKTNNPDSYGETLMSINNVKKLGIICGSDVYDTPISTGTVTFTGTGTCSALVAT